MLRKAVFALEALDQVRVVAVSSIYETEPWGLTEQPNFFNIALEIETVATPLELLQMVKTLEMRLGRLPSVRWGPRVIDIDLILWGDVVMETQTLTLPHQRFRERDFVLTPLAEIAPDAVDPITGDTVHALSEALTSQPLTRCAEAIYS